MQRHASFLAFRPSQIAAAALIFAINMTQSPVASLCRVKRIEDLTLKSLFFESVIYMEIAGVRVEESDSRCPLRMWSQSVEKLTAVKRARDVKPCYIELVKSLNAHQYDNKLSGDALLFAQESEETVIQPDH